MELSWGAKRDTRRGGIGAWFGALVGLVLGQLRGVAGGDWSLDVKTTDWVDFLGFLGTSLFVIYDMENDCQGQSFRLKKMNKVPSSIFSPEFQFLRGYSSASRDFRPGRSFCLRAGISGRGSGLETEILAWPEISTRR